MNFSCLYDRRQFHSLEQGPFEVRVLPSRRHWKIEVLSPWMVTFYRDDCQVLEKDRSGP